MCVRERSSTAEELQRQILSRAAVTELDAVLWKTVLAFQNDSFCTSTGLAFSYTVKLRKNGEYSGELLISRKEGSKTLTRSSLMLAFHRVLDEIHISEDGMRLILPFYGGPKAIGQIFGISYVYSMFWKWGLIRVPDKTEERLKCGSRITAGL